MTIELDPVIQLGAAAVAAVARRVVRRGPGRGAAFLGAKHPVAILVRRDGATLAFDIGGGAIDPEEFERRFPGQRAAFERIAPTPRERFRLDEDPPPGLE